MAHLQPAIPRLLKKIPGLFGHAGRGFSCQYPMYLPRKGPPCGPADPVGTRSVARPTSAPTAAASAAAAKPNARTAFDAETIGTSYSC